MIRLTRLNDDRFALNAELIRYVEERPDTIITLTTGERLMVRESMDDVIARTVAYHRAKVTFPMLTAETSQVAGESLISGGGSR